MVLRSLEQGYPLMWVIIRPWSLDPGDKLSAQREGTGEGGRHPDPAGVRA